MTITLQLSAFRNGLGASTQNHLAPQECRGATGVQRSHKLATVIVALTASYTKAASSNCTASLRCHCTASHCTASHCIVSHCAADQSTADQSIASHCIVSHCIVSHCIVSHCIFSHCIFSHCIASHCADSLRDLPPPDCTASLHCPTPLTHRLAKWARRCLMSPRSRTLE